MQFLEGGKVIHIERSGHASLKSPTDDPKAPLAPEQIWPAPEVPVGFWGEVTYFFRDGKAVSVDVKRSYKAP